ncbi:hypothetical protein RND71_032478 [Anisodus tanguticus]|uniref:DUF4283 domain-containing protein n=1 Tax=Anisodus tanguticus TaxID=243964 RepID=A0AAE1RDT8_9SOLA|nr:hypothetical protein RND71_032478 [Anisodus tanguticus]
MSSSIPIKPIVYLHGEPTVRFEKKEVEVMIHQQNLNLAVIGKFSHGWPEIGLLRTAIPKQCGLKAEVNIGLLCDRHVLIRCTIAEDYDTLMSRQTFEIKEKNKPYLMRTFKWDVTFNPDEETRFAYGWISFPGLPPHFHGESSLFSMAASVGIPISIDSATRNKTRPSSARVKLQGHDSIGCWKLNPELRPNKANPTVAGRIDGGGEEKKISENGDGGNPRPCGLPSPMSTPIPIKPVVYLHGEPTIRFERKEVEVMIHHQELNLAIVGKFSHGWPDIAFLRNAIPKQCGLKAEVRIGLLCDRHVLIRCTILEDFDTLMSRQTFEIKEKNKPYLMRTFKWDVSFNPAEESRFAYGWISFPGLSPHYYGETTLFSMAAAVGTPIAIDAATLNKTRPSCARVKVEFDLLRSHPQHVVIQVGEGDEITSDLQKIRYDFKPKYYINCKLQGHDVNGCWNLKPELRPENSKAIDGGKEAAAVTIGKGMVSNPPPSSSNPSQQAPISTTNTVIPTPPTDWITVTGKNKKNKKQNQKPPTKPTER